MIRTLHGSTTDIHTDEPPEMERDDPPAFKATWFTAAVSHMDSIPTPQDTAAVSHTTSDTTSYDTTTMSHIALETQQDTAAVSTVSTPLPVTSLEATPMSQENALVSDLSLPYGEWNSDLVHNTFRPDDATLILNLPRLSPNRDDTLCWHFDKRGFYSVRSGYKMALGLNERTGYSSLQLSSWWHFLWECNVPNKCKIFFWKAFHGWLPTFATLSRCRVDVMDCCILCCAASETITHILWYCQLAVDGWRMLLGEEVLQRISVSDFSDIVMCLCSTINNDLFNLFILGYWRLWTNRNCVIHGSVGWAAANTIWKPPKLDGFKINCYASFRLRSGKAGVSVIIPDYKGTAIVVKSSPVLGCNSVEMLEAQACLVGLQLAIDVGISSVVLESDTDGVIHLLFDHVVPHTKMGAIIRSSLALGASMNLLSIEAIHRGANSVAHNLTDLAFSLDGPVVWLDDLPSDIARLVHLDSISLVCSV
ncbi:hypothetical protein EZV62_007473 [Acer yangbiense]|uniref:Reverse transcriptase zinc-binding domain-containing protein n=1 Tax=Acer yangbiense TaxID=1000413 RepID=A0A5C7IAM9_9ROSI|nr:hypothetical protein EZV62_007473 [Acer yangbiense]